MNLNRLKYVLIRHEGIRLFPYCDKTGKRFKSTSECGKLTIGIGRNLEDRGITKDEALYMLENDIMYVKDKLEESLWFFNELDNIRQEVLINMAFNLGLAGLLKFKNMIKALEKKDYTKASEEMLNSKWANQVKNRAKELAHAMKYGEYPFHVETKNDKVLDYLNKMFKEINEGW